MKSYEFLLEVSRAMSDMTTLSDSLQSIAQLFVTYFNFYGAKINLYNADQTSTIISVDYCQGDGPKSAWIGDLHEIFYHRPIWDDQIVVIRDAPHDPHLVGYKYHEDMLAGGIRYIILVPLSSNGIGIGSIVLWAKDENFSYSAADLALLRVASRQIAGVVSLAQVLDIERKSRQRLSQFVRSSELLTQHLHVGKVMDSIVSLVFDFIQSDRVLLYLIREDHLTLSRTKGTNEHLLEQDEIEIDPETEKRLCNQAIMVFVHSEQTIENVRIGVPLAVADNPVGLLIINQPAGHLFEPEDLQVMRTFSNQASSALYNAHRYEYAQKAAIDNERQRLARNLHDSVTQSLYGLTLLANGWSRMAENNQLNDPAFCIRELGLLGQQGLKEMRLLIHSLRPPEVEKVGPVAALQQRLDEVEQRVNVQTSLETDTNLRFLPLEMQEHIFYITQEALNNSLRHAIATLISIHIESNSHAITIMIEDNGRGFDTSQNSLGMGLGNMRARADLINANLIIKSILYRGTTIMISIPYPPIT